MTAQLGTKKTWQSMEYIPIGLQMTFFAMARPNTEAIEKYNIIQQFRDKGISSIINLQMPGEHPYCGNALDASGFSCIILSCLWIMTVS
ncbi:protein tyrosine phosphatase domain-containing protein 1 [Caerostris extrusa]|uniref:Protein tyrosine phosphatase domain-containing protein 1 n=1 Tax=Caerostris extrusa TaxID=172846 RepID=A0AAV4NPB9_CAEEX|nr:protein tyrosine phosphatase domain-containing protein 1 [Caerostris extrusa]